jgi:hypothetical protein
MSKKRIDINGKEIYDGDIIDIHQTVNGQSLFLILRTDPLDIRYLHELTREYEYDKEGLLEPCRFSGETSFEVIENIHDILSQHFDIK